MRRILLSLMALTFIACGAVQLNDPDPERWLVVYMAAAATSALEALGMPRPVLPWGLLGVSVSWCALLVMGLDAGSWDRGLDDEVIREIGGLTLIAATMGGILAARRAAGPGSQSE